MWVAYHTSLPGLVLDALIFGSWLALAVWLGWSHARLKAGSNLLVHRTAILAHFSGPAEFHTYDPKAAEVARLLERAIRRVEPTLQVEHIGSTSVPGCGGQGIVDLAVLYPAGLLARARTVLDGLGFQRQGGPEPFPEDRPMRVGCVEHKGRSFRIHAHVIALGSVEHGELVWFRETLRRDPALRQRYEERKQAILEAGIRDSIEYSKAKGKFVTDALKARQPPA
jgi:GrpB-like predicted nucleotidyltransferase (UPF0157 family)